MRKTVSIEKVYHFVINGELEIMPNGEIYRVARRAPNKWNQTFVTIPVKRKRAEHHTGTEYCRSGYYQIRVMCDGVRLHLAAHRLIYYHFKGAIPDNMTVNHIDGNPLNNHPDNLELLSHKDNCWHARNVLKRGNFDNVKKIGKPNLTPEQKKTIIRRFRLGENRKPLAMEFNIHPNHVTRLNAEFKQLLNESK